MEGLRLLALLDSVIVVIESPRARSDPLRQFKTQNLQSQTGITPQLRFFLTLVVLRFNGSHDTTFHPPVV